jgi:hypothetical protein
LLAGYGDDVLGGVQLDGFVTRIWCVRGSEMEGLYRRYLD